MEDAGKLEEWRATATGEMVIPTMSTLAELAQPKAEAGERPTTGGLVPTRKIVVMGRRGAPAARIPLRTLQDPEADHRRLPNLSLSVRPQRRLIAWMDLNTLGMTLPLKEFG